jgi:hypothetical protein
MAVVAMASTPAWAQTPGPAPLPSAAMPSDPLLRLGPVALQPRIALTNLGVDTNVFHSAAAPTRDVTGTLVPSLDTSLRVGRSITTAKTTAELVYFRRAGNQRSMTFSQEGRFDLPLARLTPYVTGGRVNSHQRPNLEIDQRLEQRRDSVGGGVLLRVSSRTTLMVGRDQHRLRYGTDAGASFGALLDRRVTLTTATMSVALTPLTTMVIRAESQRDRFEQSSVRDADSQSVLGGFDLEPFALISGTARVGYRRVNALSPLMPDFSGLVANVNVAYVMRETLLLSLTSARNIEYSIESDEPYYVSTGATLTARQAIGRWDVLARVGRSALSYRALRLPDTTAEAQSRRDRHVSYGIGAGVRVGSALRVGVDVGHERRVSPVANRRYDGMKAGGTLTYGY